MSADISYPNKLYLSGFTSSKPKVYAYGTLVLWTTKNLELKDNIKILNNDNVNKISIANPKNAPYGEESINTLKYYKMYDQIKHKIIYGESISQINNYVILNAVDIGFTSKSSVLSPEMINKGKWIEIDKKSYKPIAQGVVILKHGIKNNADNSKKFYNFLFSKRAKKIFEKYGYIVKNNE
jgi:molybdate transport system substrate-binding protein